MAHLFIAVPFSHHGWRSDFDTLGRSTVWLSKRAGLLPSGPKGGRNSELTVSHGQYPTKGDPATSAWAGFSLREWLPLAPYGATNHPSTSE